MNDALPDPCPFDIAADALQRTIGEVVAMVRRGDIGEVFPLPGTADSSFEGMWNVHSHGVAAEVIERLRPMILGPSPARVAQDERARRRSQHDEGWAVSPPHDSWPAPAA
jgi:hypothetical protein